MFEQKFLYQVFDGPSLCCSNQGLHLLSFHSSQTVQVTVSWISPKPFYYHAIVHSFTCLKCWPRYHSSRSSAYLALPMDSLLTSFKFLSPLYFIAVVHTLYIQHFRHCSGMLRLKFLWARGHQVFSKASINFRSKNRFCII